MNINVSFPKAIAGGPLMHDLSVAGCAAQLLAAAQIVTVFMVLEGDISIFDLIGEIIPIVTTLLQATCIFHFRIRHRAEGVRNIAHELV